MHFDNPLFLILLLVAGLLRWLATKAENKKEADAGRTQSSTPAIPARERPIPRIAGDSEEERVRKFMEALGRPTLSEPPKIRPAKTRTRGVAPRQLGPLASPLPKLTTTPPALPREFVEKQIAESESAAAPVMSLLKLAPPSFEVRPIEAEQTVSAGLTTGSQAGTLSPIVNSELFLRLRTADGLREAAILREILGPPRSLRLAEDFAW